MNQAADASSPEDSPQATKRRALSGLVTALALVTGGAGLVLGLLSLQRAKDLEQESVRTQRELRSLQSNFDNLDRELSDVGLSVDNLDRVVSDVGYSVDEIESALGLLRGALNSSEDVASILESLESDMGELSMSVDIAFVAIDRLQDCVNEYMDVVGRSGGGRYTYYYC
jgi:hypothetical protein